MFYWFEREREIGSLLHVFMHSLVDSHVCPDWGYNPQPWCIRMMLPSQSLVRSFLNGFIRFTVLWVALHLMPTPNPEWPQTPLSQSGLAWKSLLLRTRGGGRSIWKLSLIFPSHTRVHPLTEKQKDASVPLGPGQSVVKSKQLCNQRKTVTIWFPWWNLMNKLN